MPRSTSAKNLDRASDILDAAVAILIEDGQEGFSMRRVADRAGIALGNLQYYFPTRAEMVSAVVDHMCARYQSEFAGDLASVDAPEKRLEMLVGYCLDDVQKPEGSILFWELWSISGHNADAADAVARLHVFIQDHLADAVRAVNPSLTPAEARLRAQAIDALIEGATVMIGAGRPHTKRPGPLRRTIIQSAIDIAKRSG